MLEVQNLHEKTYGTPPEIISHAPGRVNWLGDFTEHGQGLVLSLILDQGVCLGLSRREDALLRLVSVDLNEKKRSSLAGLRYKREDRWANYVKGALFYMTQRGRDLSGLNITVKSRLPMGIGLGTSQALVAAFCHGVNRLLNLGFDTAELLEISYLVESEFMEYHTGRASFLPLFLGTSGHASLVDTRDYSHRTFPLDNTDLAFWILNTRVPFSSFEEVHPADFEDCESGARILSGSRSARSLRDVTRTDLKEKVGQMPESVRRRCLHVVEEILRVQDSLPLLKEAQWEELGKILKKSHDSLRDLYEVSCPEIDWLVRRLVESTGVWGAKISGESRGFSVLVMTERNNPPDFSKMLEEYERIFGFKIDVFRAEPGSPVEFRDLELQPSGIPQA